MLSSGYFEFQTLSIRILFLLVLCTFFFGRAEAQGPYRDFTDTIQKLYAAEREELDVLWDGLVSGKRIPLTCGDSVAFLYRGEAASVTWMGDFNGWGNDKKFANHGARIPGSDVWILRVSLPKDARLDYKIFVNSRQWILDPYNRDNQSSGVGGGSLNSELHMPDWRPDSVTTFALPDAAAGRVQKDILINSRELGYQMTYSIYYPPGFQKDLAYPILYVTDGYEYMHEEMGNMATVLNNLIYLGKIPSVVAVFIDHREPVNRSYNRRMQELTMNEKYLRFITGELIPSVETNLTIAEYPLSRCTIGSSMGGLSAAWLAFSRPDLFPLAGIQSPAFWFQPAIYRFCENAPAKPMKIFLSTGRIHDNEEGARKMKEILERKGCAYEYKEVNQGHSWGNWRELSDDLLVYLLN